MNAYRVAAEVPQEDLRALVAEATEQVRRRHLEERLAWCNRILDSRTPSFTGASSRSADDNASDAVWPFSLILGVVALPLLAVFVYLALLLCACASLVRAWTEWRLYRKRLSPRPIASACVFAFQLSFTAYALAASVGDDTSLRAVATLALALTCAAIAFRRREWSHLEAEGDQP